jgi:hypothetical protein
MRTSWRALAMLALSGAVAVATPAVAGAATQAKHPRHEKSKASHRPPASHSAGGALYDAPTTTPASASANGAAVSGRTGGTTASAPTKQAKASNNATKHATTTSTGGKTLAASVAPPSGATGADGASGPASGGGASAPGPPAGATGASGSTGPSGPTVPGWVAKILPDGLAQAPADAPVAVKRAIAAGNQLIGQPYLYGGGHKSFVSNGYDCSGAVSYALHGGDLLSSPLDSSQFEQWGVAGSGTWITVYTNPAHAYMDIAGIRFDTSRAGDPGGKSGPRWRPLLASNAGFQARHPAGL